MNTPLLVKLTFKWNSERQTDDTESIPIGPVQIKQSDYEAAREAVKEATLAALEQFLAPTE